MVFDISSLVHTWKFVIASFMLARYGKIAEQYLSGARRCFRDQKHNGCIFASFGYKKNSVWMCHSAYMEYNHISHFLQEMALRGMAIRKRLRGVGYRKETSGRTHHGSSA